MPICMYIYLLTVNWIDSYIDNENDNENHNHD